MGLAGPGGTAACRKLTPSPEITVGSACADPITFLITEISTQNMISCYLGNNYASIYKVSIYINRKMFLSFSL